MDDDQRAPQPVSRLPLVVMGAVVVLAIAVIAALGLRGPEEFPVGSPEAALQGYLNAALDGDTNAVISFLAPEARARCANGLEEINYDWGSTGIGFDLDEMTVEAGEATADVTLRRSDNGNPFGGPSRTSGYSFGLRLVDDDWLVDAANWPWLIDNCIRRFS